MGWNLCLGVHRLFCGVIPSQDCVCGACCCWATVAVVALSFLSDNLKNLMQIPNTLAVSKTGCVYALCASDPDGPLLTETLCFLLGDRPGPQCITNASTFVLSPWCSAQVSSTPGLFFKIIREPFLVKHVGNSSDFFFFFFSDRLGYWWNSAHALLISSQSNLCSLLHIRHSKTFDYRWTQTKGF